MRKSNRAMELEYKMSSMKLLFVSLGMVWEWDCDKCDTCSQIGVINCVLTF